GGPPASGPAPPGRPVAAPDQPVRGLGPGGARPGPGRRGRVGEPFRSPALGPTVRGQGDAGALVRAPREIEEAAWLAVPGHFPGSRDWASRAYTQLARHLLRRRDTDRLRA